MRLSIALVTLVISSLGAVAAPTIVGKRSVSSAIYNDLVYYFQYASSAYGVACAKPNGNTLVEAVRSHCRAHFIKFEY